ncbi:hypothetical protein DL98DRAFT_516388, partial [Cadophora sp. DSE1049]
MENVAPTSAQPAERVQDDLSILGVPRETIEEMMRAWGKILIQGLRNENSRAEGRNEDVELGQISRATNVVEPRLEDDIQPVEPREGFWDGGLVGVMSEEEIKAEDEERALTL